MAIEDERLARVEALQLAGRDELLDSGPREAALGHPLAVRVERIDVRERRAALAAKTAVRIGGQLARLRRSAYRLHVGISYTGFDKSKRSRPARAGFRVYGDRESRGALASRGALTFDEVAVNLGDAH